MNKELLPFIHLSVLSLIRLLHPLVDDTLLGCWDSVIYLHGILITSYKGVFTQVQPIKYIIPYTEYTGNEFFKGCIFQRWAEYHLGTKALVRITLEKGETGLGFRTFGKQYYPARIQ